MAHIIGSGDDDNLSVEISATNAIFSEMKLKILIFYFSKILFKHFVPYSAKVTKIYHISVNQMMMMMMMTMTMRMTMATMMTTTTSYPVNSLGLSNVKFSSKYTNFIPENVFENGICKLACISSRP